MFLKMLLWNKMPKYHINSTWNNECPGELWKKNGWKWGGCYRKTQHVTTARISKIWYGKDAIKTKNSVRFLGSRGRSLKWDCIKFTFNRASRHYFGQLSTQRQRDSRKFLAKKNRVFSLRNETDMDKCISNLAI